MRIVAIALVIFGMFQGQGSQVVQEGAIQHAESISVKFVLPPGFWGLVETHCVAVVHEANASAEAIIPEAEQTLKLRCK